MRYKNIKEIFQQKNIYDGGENLSKKTLLTRNEGR